MDNEESSKIVSHPNEKICQNVLSYFDSQSMVVMEPERDGNCQSRAFNLSRLGKTDDFLSLRLQAATEIRKAKFEIYGFYNTLRQLEKQHLFNFNPNHKIYVGNELQKDNAEKHLKVYCELYYKKTISSTSDGRGFQASIIDLIALSRVYKTRVNLYEVKRSYFGSITTGNVLNLNNGNYLQKSVIEEEEVTSELSLLVCYNSDDELGHYYGIVKKCLMKDDLKTGDHDFGIKNLVYDSNSSGSINDEVVVRDSTDGSRRDNDESGDHESDVGDKSIFHNIVAAATDNTEFVGDHESDDHESDDHESDVSHKANLHNIVAFTEAARKFNKRSYSMVESTPSSSPSPFDSESNHKRNKRGRQCHFEKPVDLSNIGQFLSLSVVEREKYRQQVIRRFKEKTKATTNNSFNRRQIVAKSRLREHGKFVKNTHVVHTNIEC